MTESAQPLFDWTKPLPAGTIEQDRGDYLYEILEQKRGWIFDRLREVVEKQADDANATVDRFALAIRPSTKDGFRIFSPATGDLKRQIWFTLHERHKILASRRDSLLGDCGVISYEPSPEVELVLVEENSNVKPLTEIAQEHRSWLLAEN
ncbi:hypothetical protein ACFPT7_21620 [Acidicapsa dinghuensis]|uniref:Uncharacterized protein n=1 Tax=Acidicapsa dinghuensis TaxID=2218256 RepID=A0ABW1EKU2_9BACT|nr:hypothetical protein [Acidicapsa dinghuensis]